MTKVLHIPSPSPKSPSFCLREGIPYRTGYRRADLTLCRLGPNAAAADAKLVKELLLIRRQEDVQGLSFLLEPAEGTLEAGNSSTAALSF
ncbi:hypothetical protein EYF80_010649 [Liparis tanakae]|uniref:Uncharacterized protein n=1 Tax=Liparis tanakae TaxID=230148 RepID=A0A4Z2ILP2_9TELE|nr:hypothetical protein EYF80_010649 [Liparis tanakae]